MAEMRLLVIDDEVHIRAVAKASLEVLGGWSVDTAGSGPEGYAIAREDPPLAILLDLNMPGEDGMQTLARLKADEATRAIPVILFTARLQTVSTQELTKAGVLGVIEKPFDPRVMAGDVADFLSPGALQQAA